MSLKPEEKLDIQNAIFLLQGIASRNLKGGTLFYANTLLSMISGVLINI